MDKKNSNKIVLFSSIIMGTITPMINSLLASYGVDYGGYSIGQILLGFFIFLMVVYFPRDKLLVHTAIRSYFPLLLFFYFLIIVFCMQLVLFVFEENSVWNPGRNMSYLVKVGFVYLMYIHFYCAWTKGEIDIIWLRKLVLTVLYVLIASQFVAKLIGFKNNVYDGPFVLGGLGNTAVTTASGMLALVPILIYLIDQKNVKIGHYITNNIFTLFTYRRSAILADVLVLGLLMFRGIFHRNRKNTLLVLVMLTSVALLVANTNFGDAFMKRLSDLNIVEGGTGSGRTIIWTTAITYIVDRDLFTNMIGSGIGRLGEILEVYFGERIGAHNDWIEIFVSFGAIGEVLFAFVMFHVLRHWMKERRTRSDSEFISVIMVIIILETSLVTGGVLEPAFAILFGFYGVLLSDSSKVKREGDEVLNR